MDFDRSTVLGLSYGIPLAGFVVILSVLSVVNRNINAFILKSVLGIEFNAQNTVDSRTVKQYLFVSTEDQLMGRVPAMRCYARFFSDLLVSAIFSTFIAVIFRTLIIGFENVRHGEKCPDFNSICYPNDESESNSPAICRQRTIANFSNKDTAYLCFALLYTDVNGIDVLETIGICGGLIGIISSIVPLTFHCSRHRKCLFQSFFCIILPLGAVAMLFATTLIDDDEVPTSVALMFSCLLIVLLTFGWVWAFRLSWNDAKHQQQYWGGKFPFCYCFRDKPAEIVTVDQKTTTVRWCYKKYEYYPFCCLSSCPVCCENQPNWGTEAEEDILHDVNFSPVQSTLSSTI